MADAGTVTEERVLVGGPFFEDLAVGWVFDEAPALTLTAGHAALYQALFGDRMGLPLDAELSLAVTGRAEPLAHPMLVCNLAIGQTTGVTQRVRANLFYRGLILLRPVFLGDTLRTRTEVVGLKQNRLQPGKPATGLVALRIRTENQRGEAVLDFWRCPMLPLRDPEVRTGLADSFDGIPTDLDPAALAAAVPERWRPDALRRAAQAAAPAEAPVGTTFAVEGRDTVTGAPELARLTLNVAALHTDAAASPYGRRLVYGGHTISMACAQITRALPGLATILAWRSCDHQGPVFEGDVLRTEVTVEGSTDAPGGWRLLDLRACVFAHRKTEPGESPVLDWRLVALASADGAGS